MQTTKKQSLNLDNSSQSRLCESVKTDTLRPKSLLAGSISIEEVFREILSFKGYTFIEWPNVDGGCITCERNGVPIPLRFRSYYDIAMHYHIHYWKSDFEHDCEETDSIFKRLGI